MNSTILAALQEAYALIQAGRSAEAQAILIPLVRDNPDVADAWYMLGKVLTDREKSLYAYRQVLRIDPTNQRALRQIEKLTSQPTSTVTSAAVPKKKRRKSSQRNMIILAVSGLLGLCCIGAVAFFAFGAPLQAQLAPATATAQATATSAPPTATFTPSPVPSPTFIPPTFRSGGCPFDVPLGTRVRCGTVRVPQDRTKNRTDLIELPVVVYRSSKPNADAVIFLQGGPGAESIDWSLALFDEYVKPILQDHDMIFFDPRGTGRSKPALDCPELNSVFLDAYYQNRTQDEAFQDFLAVWGKCHERFLATGVDPAAFNTTQSAGDVHDIVVALGYKQVSMIGISYGTRLGLTVMRDYPEIVRATVLDSVVPVEGKMFNRRASDSQYVLDKVFADCANSPRCNAAYPDLAKVFADLIEKFDKKPATVQALSLTQSGLPTIKVNGVDMISAVVAGMHRSELVSVIPKAIYDIQKGDYTFLSYSLGGQGGEYNTTGMGTYFSTVCPEQVYTTTPEQMDSDLNISPSMKEFALNGLFGSVKNVFDLCGSWNAKPGNPQDGLPVKSKQPTLIISGQYDPTTPTLTGEMVAADLPNHYFYVIPGMGHGATIGNACSASIMLAFLKAPEKAPDSTCLTARPFEFFLPYDGSTPIDLVEFSDSAYGVQGLAPSGWKKSISDGYYARRAYLFDVTQIQASAVSAPANAVLAGIKSSFVTEGRIATPKFIQKRLGNRYTWSIYGTSLNGEPIIFGLCEIAPNRTMMLIMVVSAPERDAFYDGLFIPMLKSLQPLG